MKLNQLGLTPAGQKATKKLPHQVHKATVAAALAPRLDLGVIGISIGQEQSTGSTSLVEAQDDGVITSLIKAARAINFDGNLPLSTDRSSWLGALQVARARAGEPFHSTTELASSVWSIVREAQTAAMRAAAAEELVEAEVDAGAIGEASKLLVRLAELKDATTLQARGIDQVLSLIGKLRKLSEDDTADGLNRKLAQAVLKKAGLL